MPERIGLHHVAVNVRSLKDTIAFYEAIGCKLVRVWPAEEPKNAMVDAGGVCLELFENDKGDPEADAVLPHLAFLSNDVDGDFAAALKAGATVRTEPFDLVLGSEPPCPIRIAFVFGINGEVLEFFHER